MQMMFIFQHIYIFIHYNNYHIEQYNLALRMKFVQYFLSIQPNDIPYDYGNKLILSVYYMEYQHKDSHQFGPAHRQRDFQDRIKEQLSNEEGNLFVQPSFFRIEQEEQRQNYEFKRTRSTCNGTNTNYSQVNVNSKMSARQQGKKVSKFIPKMSRQNRWTLGSDGLGNLLSKGYPQSESCRYLKARLHELLKNEQVETQVSEETSYPSLPIKPQQIYHNRPHQSHFHHSHAKIESKTMCLMLNVSHPKNGSIKLVTKKEILKTKFSDKFPKIDKRLARQKLKHLDKISFISGKVENDLRTRYQNPDRQQRESYLEPVNKIRKTQPFYVLTVESLNPLNKTSPFNDTQQANASSETGKLSNYDTLMEIAKKIKFK